MEITHQGSVQRAPWNKGKLVGQKAPLKQREIWAIRIRLQLAERTRELALFNLAVDSKLRSCDLVRLRVKDVTHGDQVANRAIVIQQKTRRSVQFEITEQTRESIAAWIRCANRRPEDYLFRVACALLLTSQRGNCADRPKLGAPDRPEPVSVSNPHAAPHQGFAHLSQDEEPRAGSDPRRKDGCRDRGPTRGASEPR